MKPRILLCCAVLLTAVATFGCGGQSADQYAGDRITELKEGDPSVFNDLLEQGIKTSNTTYVLDFPEDLKETYLEFLQTSFSSMKFEVEGAKEKMDGVYAVNVSFTPVDFQNTLQKTNDEILTNPNSADFTETALFMIKADKEQMHSDPVFTDKTTFELMVSESDSGFSIHDTHFMDFLNACMNDYMSPYNSCCDLYEIQDFIKSYLDASFKGEVTQFALHVGFSEEEALAWYESDVFDIPEGFNPAYEDRYRAALQSIMKQCRYTMGIPRKESEPSHYQVDVAVTPNNSLTDTFSEYSSQTYYSLDEASAALVEILERYAASPSYGEETMVTIPVNENSLIDTETEESDLTRLVYTILPPA